MNLDLLIDSIVRQTTVLIAQLATAAGGRAPLAHTANQVFTDLNRELKEQGLGSKVIADMFGLTLRTYHNRIRRLGESSTFKGRSLWESILSHIEENGTVRRADVLLRFCHDDERTVRAILNDLVEGGLVFRSGRGDHVAFRATTPDEMRTLDAGRQADGLAHLLVIAISRFGPLTAGELAEHVRMPAEALEKALASLTKEGRIQVKASERGEEYSCEQWLIPFGEPSGWEAAVFDHYQALVTALCVKLRKGRFAAALGDAIGGSTYTFDVWHGHPLEREVLGLLSTFRSQGRAMREKVEAYNAEHEREGDPSRERRVITYVGQVVLDTESEEENDGW
jgi:hypothetical protein